jgi:hypothetical protein
MPSDPSTVNIKPTNHTGNSSYREKLIEHLFIAELLKLSWLHRGCSLEIAKPEVDSAGYDLIAEARGCIRHIQLKTTLIGGKARSQKVHTKLAEKPSGCVVWIYFDEKSLRLGPFYYFGSAAGKPLPRITDYKIAKHTKGDKGGFKAERPNIRVIPIRDFDKLDSIEEVFAQLFEIKSEKPAETQAYSSPALKHSRNAVGVLPIELVPADPSDFKDALLRSRKATIEIIYSNGSTEQMDWDAERFSPSSNVIGNLRSRPEFRQGEWQKRGILRICVRVKSLNV